MSIRCVFDFCFKYFSSIYEKVIKLNKFTFNKHTASIAYFLTETAPTLKLNSCSKKILDFISL